MWMLNRQGQVQGGPREGGGAAEADQQAGGDQGLPRGWCGVWKAEVRLLHPVAGEASDLVLLFSQDKTRQDKTGSTCLQLYRSGASDYGDNEKTITLTIFLL